MLLQGLSMCFWYNSPATFAALEALNATSNVLNFIFQVIQGLKQDFEIQRFHIGLTSLVTTDPASLP